MSKAKIVNFIITIIGFFGTIIGIYSYFFSGKEINLQYEILANTNVLDIKANVTKLDILYGGESLKANDLNLRIVTIKILNAGPETILKDYYDDNDLLGLYLDKGQIIESPEILEANNAYLKSNLYIDLKSGNEARFSKVILEPGDYFVLKVVVLHPATEQPLILALGKVANVRNIEIINDPVVSDGRNFIIKNFEGSFITQLIRLMVYTIISIVIFIIIAFTISLVSDFKTRTIRKKYIREFKDSRKIYLANIYEFIFSRYIKDGFGRLNEMLLLLNNPEKIKQYMIKFDGENLIPTKEYDILWGEMKDSSNTQELLKDGFFAFEANKITINEQMHKCLKLFVKFLEEKGEKNYFNFSSVGNVNLSK